MKKITKFSSIICSVLLTALGFSSCGVLNYSSQQTEEKKEQSKEENKATARYGMPPARFVN